MIKPLIIHLGSSSIEFISSKTYHDLEIEIPTWNAILGRVLNIKKPGQQSNLLQLFSIRRFVIKKSRKRRHFIYMLSSKVCDITLHILIVMIQYIKYNTIISCFPCKRTTITVSESSTKNIKQKKKRF